MIIFNNLTLKRGVTTLIENANATINPGQKVGLVGKNGCGKSSLFALLKQEMSSEAGEVKLPQHWALAWVNQETPALDIPALDYVIQGDHEYVQLMQALQLANQRNDGNAIATIHGQLDAIDAWSIEARAATLLNGLGFENHQLQSAVKSFSGGWRMRLNLAQALICRSDLLLLDEPTNHLDLDAVIWLERWLSRYSGTLILISHDRDFLDPVVNKIIHIEQQQLNEYSGDYSSFEKQRATKLAQQAALYRQQQQKVAHLQHYIDRFRAKATKAKQAQSRIKALERMELIAPAYVDNPFHFEFRTPDALPNPILTMEKVSAGYQDTTILHSIKLNLVPGSRIGLLGKNGAGKSTLIKLLASELSAQQGIIHLAKGVKLGYFAQHQLDTLRADESALWHLNKIATECTEQQQRDYLGGFAFHGDKVKQPVSSFSGGEKARLVLALIVWQKPNLLLLDEPTNHLDLDMRQALTEALVDYQGSLVVVSHDRHLLRNTVDDFYLVHDGQVQPFNGDLADYQKWLNESAVEINNAASTTNTSVENENSAINRKEQKRLEAELRQKLAPLKKQAQILEKQMDQYQAELSHVENALADNNLYDEANKAKLTQLLAQQVELKKQLETVEFEWLSVQEQIEIISLAANQ